MPTAHPLDRPAWTALTGRQAHLAQGGPGALRFDPRYGPFAGARDTSPESLAALAALGSPNGGLWTVEAEPAPTPPGLSIATRAPCEQMVAAAISPGVLR